MRAQAESFKEENQTYLSELKLTRLDSFPDQEFSMKGAGILELSLEEAGSEKECDVILLLSDVSM